MRGEGYSLSDIAAATGNGMGGFSDNGAWWIIVLIVLFGWGRNGFGGSGSGAMDNYVLNSDFATLQRQLSDGFGTVEKGLDTVRNGLCDGFYTNAQLINGVNTNILQGNNTLNTSVMGGVNTLQGAIKDCCCTTQRSIDNVNFNNAQNTSLITNAITLNGRDIIDNMNANYRAIHEELVANKLELKNERIAEQQNEINALRLAASQSEQNNYIVNTLSDRIVPQARPSYIVPNLNCCYNSCGCSNGCGM